MADNLRSILQGTLALGVVAVVSAVLCAARDASHADRASLEQFTRLYLVGIALQCVHFAEEFGTRFFERFPELLGLVPWSGDFFVVFNLIWLAVWVLSAVGVWANIRLAYFPAWFFALGMLANGVAHPVLAAYAGGYFPGLVTSPFVGVIGLVLTARLWRLTRTIV